ncbi:OsmC family protein [Microbacterium sp. KR10-403]|uniref:OsmC family protein n=1 Tax=Microbacterium sp. KR10-403 TaxID=3158581 RepID=UPI0032E463ED
MGGFEAVAAAGSFRDDRPDVVVFPHRWSDEGVSVRTDFTGAHLLHLAVAGCVLNDVYREAVGLGITIDGVRVTADGGFDTDEWTSTGIEYRVEIDTPASRADVEALIAQVDAVAEIPQVLRVGMQIDRAR